MKTLLALILAIITVGGLYWLAALTDNGLPVIALILLFGWAIASHIQDRLKASRIRQLDPSRPRFKL